MFCKKINLLILFALFAGCATTNTKPEQPELLLKTEYGIWQQESCKLSSHRAGVKVTLTDMYVEEKARVLLQFDEMLEKKPSFKIYGFEDYDLEIYGHGNTYSLEIPTTLIDQARMHLNEVFLEVSYQTQNRVYNRKAFFSLNKLPEAMLDIKRYCK
jgi:hypothetical protein